MASILRRLRSPVTALQAVVRKHHLVTSSSPAPENPNPIVDASSVAEAPKRTITFYRNELEFKVHNIPYNLFPNHLKSKISEGMTRDIKSTTGKTFAITDATDEDLNKVLQKFGKIPESYFLYLIKSSFKNFILSLSGALGLLVAYALYGAAFPQLVPLRLLLPTKDTEAGGVVVARTISLSVAAATPLATASPLVPPTSKQ